MSPERELNRLWKLDYGRPAEVVARLGLIAIAGGVLHVYAEYPLALPWVAAVLLLHVAFACFLRWRLPKARVVDTYIATAIWTAMVAAFLSVPLMLLLQDDVAMLFASAAGILCAFMFMIWRADGLIPMLVAQIAMGAVVCTVTLLHYLSEASGPAVRAVLIFSTLAVFLYFTQVIITAHVVRKARLGAAERSAQARKMEAVGQLAGGVAHDFNNILTAIQGNLELYSALSTEAEKAEVIENAHEAALRAAGLVQHLLAYARSAPMRPGLHPVAGIFAKVEQLSRRLIPTSVALEFDPGPEGQEVSVDDTQMITALINLIVNARDAMPQGGTIALSARPLPVQRALQCDDGASLPRGDYLAVEVANTGPGIPADLRDKVFEPFFTTKPVGEGSGLGLSMVSGFVRQSGGGTLLQTGPEGTRIGLILPSSPQPGRAPAE